MHTRLEDFLKTFWIRLAKTSSKPFKKTYCKTKKCYAEDFFKTSWRRLGKQVMFLGMVRNSCHFICLRLLTTFLEFDPRLHCFYKLNLYWTYPDNWTLLYEALSMLATKKNACSREKCTSLFKNPSHFIHFCKHKLCWIFNITQSSGLRWNFWSFLKLTSHLKNFLVIGVSNCCSASLSSVYLMV